MNKVNGELIKNLREELELSQEDFAEKISVSISTLYRMENNKSEIDVFQYMDILRMCDRNINDYFLLFWDSKEHQEYRQFMGNVTDYCNQQRFGEFVEIMKTLKDNDLINDPTVQQIIKYAEIRQTVSNRGDNEWFNPQDLDEWYNAIAITKKDFDEEKVAGYLLNTCEVNVISALSMALSYAGQHEKAILLATNLVNNKSIKMRFQVNSSDYINNATQMFFIAAYENAKMYSDALHFAQNLIARCISTKSFISIDTVLGRAATNYKRTGEDELLYKTYFIRAYCCNLLQRGNPLAAYEQIAKEDFGVELSDWIDF